MQEYGDAAAPPVRLTRVALGAAMLARTMVMLGEAGDTALMTRPPKPALPAVVPFGATLKQCGLEAVATVRLPVSVPVAAASIS